MTLSVAIGLSALLSAAAWKGLKQSKSTKLGLFLIAFGWLAFAALALTKIQLGCRPLGDCYGTEYDGDLLIAEMLPGMLVMAGWVLTAIGFVLYRRSIRFGKLHAES